MAVGAAFLLAGLVGAGITAVGTGRYHKYKLFYSIGLAGTTVAYFFAFLAVRLEQVLGTVIAVALMGFFELPIRSLGIAFMCQVAYPVSTSAVFHSILRRGADMRAVCGGVQSDLAGSGMQVHE